jgi:hypothetical protein
MGGQEKPARLSQVATALLQSAAAFYFIEPAREQSLDSSVKSRVIPKP